MKAQSAEFLFDLRRGRHSLALGLHLQSGNFDVFRCQVRSAFHVRLRQLVAAPFLSVPGYRIGAIDCPAKRVDDVVPTFTALETAAHRRALLLVASPPEYPWVGFEKCLVVFGTHLPN